MAAFISKDDQRIASLMKELYSFGGYLPLTQIARFLNCVPKEASKWVANNPNYFKIINNEEGCPNVLGITKVTFCKTHASKPGSCSGCDSLHVCKFFVLGDSCKFGSNCVFCHSLETAFNKRVLEKYNLHQLDEQELRCLFQKLENRDQVTTPMICKFFNNNNCKKNDCICLHICKHYLMNDCKFGKRCKINHDLKRNVKILKMYGITFSSISDALSKLRILYNVQNNSEESESSTFKIKKVPPTKVNIICLHHLSLNQCLFKDACRYHHKEMPYQWQYKIISASNAEWQDFTDWNEQIEREFCNLENECQITDSNSNAKFQFEIMRCFIDKQEYLLQRLSTISYKSDPGRHLSTTWIWWWKNKDNIWIKYGSPSSRTIDVTNEDIEKSYLDNPEGTMVIKLDGKHEIKIDFLQMYQECVHKREVIRRPEFISREIAAELRQKPFKSIKKLNPSMDPSGSSCC